MPYLNSICFASETDYIQLAKSQVSFNVQQNLNWKIIIIIFPAKDTSYWDY